MVILIKITFTVLNFTMSAPILSHILQIAKHWSTNLTPKMTTEKLQLLATSAFPTEEKESILVLWNKSKQVRVALHFPIAPFSDSVFTMYLHKYVFWSQLKVAALNQLEATLATTQKRDGREPSLTFDEYIDKSRQRHWDYTFVEQIKLKQINKLNEWDGAKSSHEERAMLRLVYRYWMHILTQEGVVYGPHLSFISSAAKGNSHCMYTSKQFTNWSATYLKLCHWYIEMNPKATPAHEEDNRRAVELEFVVASDPILPPSGGPEKSIHGSRSKSKDASKDVSGGTKTGKQGTGGSSKRPLKRGKVSQPDATEAAPAENVVKSVVKLEAKSDPAPVMTLPFANALAPREDLVQRCESGSFIIRILNQSIAEFLRQRDRSEFDTAMIQVSH